MPCWDYARADPLAEQGMREAIRLCLAKAGFGYTPPNSDMALYLNQAMTQIYGSAENYMLATGVTYNSFFSAAAPPPVTQSSPKPSRTGKPA